MGVQTEERNPRFRKDISAEGFVFLAGFTGLFLFIGMKMGLVNLLNTMTNTANDLLFSRGKYAGRGCYLSVG